eukprot:1190493-Prorocentrum_minimum.AAC.4
MGLAISPRWAPHVRSSASRCGRRSLRSVARRGATWTRGFAQRSPAWCALCLPNVQQGEWTVYLADPWARALTTRSPPALLLPPCVPLLTLSRPSPAPVRAPPDPLLPFSCPPVCPSQVSRHRLSTQNVERLVAAGESHRLLEDLPWGVHLSADALQSLKRLAAGLKRAVMERLIRIASGHPPKYPAQQHEALGALIQAYPCEHLRVVWTVDVDRATLMQVRA